MTYGIQRNDNDTMMIYPFRTDSGYVCVVPTAWKNDIRIVTQPEGLVSDSVIIRYSQLGSVFIKTKTKSMEAVHSSQNHEYKEPGQIWIVDAKGEVVFSDSLDYIKGRGNTSWIKEKKSYNIKLSHKRKLLDLKKSSKYNLVSTHGLTNPLALQIAKEIGTSSPISFHLVNLYLNGLYNGLYLITNRIEASNSGVDIIDLDKQNKRDKKETKETLYSEDKSYKYVSGQRSPDDITGGYIIEVMNFRYKYKNLPCGFISEEGNNIRFKAPKEATEEEVLYIRQKYNDMYTAIKAPDGYNQKTKQYYTDFIDIESFAKYYLVEESLSNMDAGYGNLYFYKDCDSIDSRFKLGPIWDMEWTMGVNTYPYFSYPNALNLRAGSNDENQKMFYYLAQHKDFRLIVDSLYQNVLYPVLHRVFSTDTIPAAVDNDGTLNYLRWPDNYKASTEEYQHLREYMIPHINYLKRIFCYDFEKENYCQIVVNAGYSNRNIMFLVKKGEYFVLPELPWFSTDGKEKKKEGWLENGQLLNKDTIFIDSDKYFELKWK